MEVRMKLGKRKKAILQVPTNNNIKINISSNIDLYTYYRRRVASWSVCGWYIYRMHRLDVFVWSFVEGAVNYIIKNRYININVSKCMLNEEP